MVKVVDFMSCIFHYNRKKEKKKKKEGCGKMQVLYLCYGQVGGRFVSPGQVCHSARGEHTREGWGLALLLRARLGTGLIAFLGKPRKLADSQTSSSVCPLWFCLIRRAWLMQRIEAIGTEKPGLQHTGHFHTL